MNKVKKSRKKKKQAQRQIPVRKSKERPDEVAEPVEPDVSGHEIKETDIVPGPVDEGEIQTSGSMSAPETLDNKRGPWLDLLAAVLICGLAFAIYSNTLNVPFVFDDRYNITDNPAIQITELTLENLWGSAFESKMPNRPVTNVSLALNYYFHQKELPGYHLVNIFIHAVTGVLLYFLFLVTLRTPTLKKTFIMPEITAFGAAAIWLAHPLQTQSVTYVIQRMNSCHCRCLSHLWDITCMHFMQFAPRCHGPHIDFSFAGRSPQMMTCHCNGIHTGFMQWNQFMSQLVILNEIAL